MPQYLCTVRPYSTGNDGFLDDVTLVFDSLTDRVSVKKGFHLLSEIGEAVEPFVFP